MSDDAEDLNTQFFAIVNDICAEQANDYLDGRLAAIDKWVEHRNAIGAPADLRSLIMQVMGENNQRGPVIVAMCAAMWRLREERERAAHEQQGR